jgi:Trk K+ transport system NAD-binding subunit
MTLRSRSEAAGAKSKKDSVHRDLRIQTWTEGTLDGLSRGIKMGNPRGSNRSGLTFPSLGTRLRPMMMAEVLPSVIVVGLQSLGLAIVRDLVGDGTRVTVLALPAEAERHRYEFERLGVRVLSAAAGAPETLLAAGIETAAATILTDDDDAQNVDICLTVRRLRKDIAIVVRIFDHTLGAYLRGAVDGIAVLSIADTAAAVFAEGALGVLSKQAHRRSRRRLVIPSSPLKHAKLDRILVVTLVCHFLLVTTSTLYFAYALHLNIIDALYFVASTVTTVGYGDISLREATHAAKLVGMFLMFTGTAFVAVFFGLFTGWVVDKRLDALHGRIPVRGSGHVVIGGAGNVGYRVAGLLSARGYRVVVVERDAANRNVAALRSDGHHVIVADLSIDETWSLARIETAAAVLALTDSDATNLKIVLKIQAKHLNLPTIVRLVSPELSAHMSMRGDAVAASPVRIAADAFIHEVRSILGAKAAGQLSRSS